MKKLFLIALTWASILSIAFAQDTTQKELSTKTPKWEIATDLLWLIDKQNVSPTSIFIRKHFTTKNGQKSALRGRIGLDLESISIPDDIPDATIGIGVGTASNDFKISPILHLGYEWRTSITPKLIFYRGIEVFGGHTWYNFIRIIEIQTVDYYGKTNNKWTDLRLGTSGIIGFQYFFTKHFSASYELTATLNYLKQRGKVSVEYFDNITNAPRPDALGLSYPLRVPKNITTFKFQPISVINLSFHF